LNEIVYFGLRPGIAMVPEIEQRIPVARHPFDDFGQHLAGDAEGKLLATTVGLSATGPETLGCDRPGCRKYFIRGPFPPIAVEMKMVSDTPVWAVLRFAISTTSSSSANSSAKRVSAGICIVSFPIIVCAYHKTALDANRVGR
jgi:hypothetical protein